MTIREAVRQDMANLPYERSEVKKETVERYKREMADNHDRYMYEARRKTSQAAELSRQTVLS
jgi:hypothetical protein